MDRATFFAILARVWQFVSGPVTVLMIVWHFRLIEQGYYYAFAPILAAQLFFEVSLHVVIINVASHEWTHCALDGSTRQVTGDENACRRLGALLHRMIRWYSVASVLFVVGISVGGTAFLADDPPRTMSVERSASVISQQIVSPTHSAGSSALGATALSHALTDDLELTEWVPPWLCLVLCNGVMLMAIPFTSLLEGCGQIAVVYRYRVLQAVFGSLAVWLSITLGLGLWAVVASACVRIFWDGMLLIRHYGAFFQSLLRVRNADDFDWKNEVWPLQWRLAVQSIFGYFAMHLFTLVVWRYSGKAAAARFGLTWNILVALSAGAFAWVDTRRPMFGTLISQRDYQSLDRHFFRLTTISSSVLIIGGLTFSAAVAVMNQLDWWLAVKISGRMLPAFPTLLLVVAVVLFHLPRCQDIYVRAHKQDPFLLAVILNSTCMGLLVWQGGKRYGALGVIVAYLAVIACVQLPVWSVIWYRFRQAALRGLNEAEGTTASV